MVAVAHDDVGLVEHTDGKRRCWWCGTDPDYVAYHDTEWGRWPGDDEMLFEKLCLEGFQAGLSWITILRRRAVLRAHFFNFSPHQLNARDDQAWQDIRNGALSDPRMIRHAGKIDAVRHNAAVYTCIVDDAGSLGTFVHQWWPADHTRPKHRDDIPATTSASLAMTRALRQYGWRFIGPISAYAFMQSMGLVNDHLVGCDTA